MRMWLCGIALVIVSAGAYGQQKWDTLPKLQDHYRARVAEFKKLPAAVSKTLILGNGLVENGNWKALLRDSSVANFGIEGDITYGVMVRLREVVSSKPSLILIEIGADDFSKGIPEENVMENIFSIAHKLRKALPSSKIVVQGIIPVNPTFKNFPKGYSQNDRFFTVNEQLRRYALKIGYTYVDLYSGFVDTKGQLETKYTTDGVHLTPAGYERWASRLREDKIID